MKDCEVELDFPSKGASRTDCWELAAWDPWPSENDDLSRVAHCLPRDLSGSSQITSWLQKQNETHRHTDTRFINPTLTKSANKLLCLKY